MPDFAPPRGQSCKNCRCFDNLNEGQPPHGNCSLAGIGSACKKWPDGWCGDWRGNADVRCGRCEHFDQPKCPCVLYASTGLLLGPSSGAFACTRFEEKAT